LARISVLVRVLTHTHTVVLGEGGEPCEDIDKGRRAKFNVAEGELFFMFAADSRGDLRSA